MRALSFCCCLFWHGNSPTFFTACSHVLSGTLEQLFTNERIKLDELSAGDVFVGVERRLNESRNPPSVWVGFRHHGASTAAAAASAASSKEWQQ